jgi:Serine/threonine protein kinase
MQRKKPIGRLLHNRYLPIRQLNTRRTADIIWAQDLRAHRTIVTLKRIALSTFTLASPQLGATAPGASFTVGMLHYINQLRKLQHPGLPAIHDTFIENGQLYIVLDDIEGETLENYCLPKTDRLAQTGSQPRPITEVLDIGIQLCKLLGYLHLQKPAITAKHLHPSTLIRSSNGRISFVGLYTVNMLETLEQAQTKNVSHHTNMKLRGYFAPELCHPNTGRVDTSIQPSIQANIYSLGVLLHQLSTGYDPNEIPFSFAPLRTFNNPALRVFDNLLQRMLSKGKDKRPQHMYEVEISLRQIQRYYAVAKAEIIEALSPYEAALDTPQLTIVKES